VNGVWTPTELCRLAGEVRFSTRQQLTLTEAQAGLLLGYVDMLALWSQKMSLVSSADPRRIINEHILDSAAAFQIVPRETFYLDIGSGAGLPGVVFAILEPEARVVLLEPRQKRVEFLKEVKRRLGLENVSVLGMRLEDWTSAESGCVAVQRAVGDESRHFQILKWQIPSAVFAPLVSMTWQNKAPLGELLRDDSYTLPNGAEHHVPCFT